MKRLPLAGLMIFICLGSFIVGSFVTGYEIQQNYVCVGHCKGTLVFTYLYHGDDSESFINDYGHLLHGIYEASTTQCVLLIGSKASFRPMNLWGGDMISVPSYVESLGLPIQIQIYI